MIICVGEILADMIGQMKSKNFFMNVMRAVPLSMLHVH